MMAALHAMHAVTNAQVGTNEARVTSIRGRAVLSRQASAPLDVARGIIVLPGDEIDTRAGARVAIELGDGSLVVIQPGSLVVVRDYRNASSLRELLQIVVGRVRVRINHLGGR